jgi:hypothetical protein
MDALIVFAAVIPCFVLAAIHIGKDSNVGADASEQ